MTSRAVVPLGVLLTASAACLLCIGGCRKAPQPRVTVNGNTFYVEIADTDEVRTRGLGGRVSLPEGRGMLFVFDAPKDQTFWMKGCYVPIDIAFIDDQGRIVNLETMPIETDPARPDPSHRYSSASPVRYVLEVPGGTWELKGIKAGMTVGFVDIKR